MKISRNVVITLASEDGDAKFTFRIPGLNDLQREAQALKEISDGMERVKQELTFSFEKLLNVEGLYDEDGKALTVDDVRALTLPMNVLLSIQAGYTSAYIGLLKTKEPPPEKKDASSA